MGTEPILVKNKGGVFVAFWAVVAVLFAAVAAQAWRSASTTTGRLVGTLFFGALAAGVAYVAVEQHRHPQRLSVTDQSITSTYAGKPVSIKRTDGAELSFVTATVAVGYHQSRHWVLSQSGTDAQIRIQSFNRNDVEQACRDRGWQFTAIPA